MLPQVWHNDATIMGEKWTKLSGKDWLTSFMKRHQLSVQKPQITSQARADAFNNERVGEFYDKLADVMDRYKFDVHEIWNLDETGITTAQDAGDVVASKCVKQVDGITAADREQLVTIFAACWWKICAQWF